MKHITQIGLAVVVAGAFIASSSAQNPAMPSTTSQNSSTSAQTSTPAEPSLGNFARTVRKEKKQEASKVFDNDNLPREDKLSVVGTPSDSTAAAGASDQQAAAPSAQASKPSNPAVTPGESPEQRQQVFDAWKGKLSTQQSQIDQLSHELDLEQREYQLHAADYYRDAGGMLRNQAVWNKENAEYTQKIAEQQKALDEAKQKLSDMQEDARKSGVPSSVTDSQQQ